MLSEILAKVPALACAALLVAACNETATPPLSLDSAEPVSAQHGAVQDRDQPVLSLADLSMVGSSNLNRTPNGVSFRLSTTDLVPGHAYTLWIIIFNDTEGCTDGTPGFAFCGPFDVVNDDARPDMMYAAGTVVGGSGKATFAGRRNAGDLAGSINGPVGLPAYGLEDPSGAEIHLAVHDHGPKLPAFMPDMIKTVDGGCTDAGIPEAGEPSPWNDPPGFGRRGLNTCATIQIAVHSPGQP